ncbi:MAG: ABC transporter permease [Streptosporangiaceae bacterium]
MSRGMRVRLTRWAVVAAFLALLEVAPRAGLGDTITLIPLSEMVSRLFSLAVGGQLTQHILATVTEFLLSFVAAAVTGVSLGYVLWRFGRLRRALNPYLTTYYAIPVFAFYPLLLAIFGANLVPIVLIAWAWAVVAVILNTALGLAEIPSVLHKLGKAMRLPLPTRVFRILLPASAPYLFTGLKLDVVYSLIGVIASEFILSTRGLGYLVSNAYTNFATADMYAAILLIVVLALVLTSFLNRVESRVRRHVASH